VLAEYAAAASGTALFDDSSRGLIQVTGKDRAAWLHNLVSNSVKTLEPRQGCYAFALNVKGRILFDLNILALADALWLDIDRRLVAKAMAHLDRYIIAEDVKLADRSEDYRRFLLLGPQAVQVADALGATQIADAAQLSHSTATLVGKSRVIVRHDLGGGAGVPPADSTSHGLEAHATGHGLEAHSTAHGLETRGTAGGQDARPPAGLFRAELYVEAADADACWKRLLEIGAPVGLRPVSEGCVETLRIEAGIPASVQDIDEEVLPAETMQLERAVNFRKGCYLGQEVVERMRSHNVLARRLVGLRLDGAVTLPAVLRSGEVEVGRVTSACESPAAGGWIGLGYVKTSHAAEGASLTADGGVAATVSSLPFRVARASCP
jgi:folate-binding protein YgfZ